MAADHSIFDSASRRGAAAGKVAGRALLALLLTVGGLAVIGVEQAAAGGCVSIASGNWAGTFTSTQVPGEAGTWDGAQNFSSDTAPATQTGTYDSYINGDAILQGSIASGSVDCGGDWTATINDGELIIDIQGVISADTEVAKFKVLSGTSQVDAGSLQGVVKPDTSAISQGEGPTTGGNSVTLTGQDYQNATSVSFGATSAPFTVTSDTQITTTAPVGGGTVSVTVTSAQGTGQGVPYSYLSDYSSTVLSDNPIVYWPLGDPAGSTTANDVSGGGRQGTYTSCATRGAPGPIAHDASTAATFSADGCYMQFTPGGGDSYWGSFSAEAWFKATGSITQEFRTLISSRTSNGEYSFDFGVTGTTFGDGQTLHADIGDGNEWLNTGDVPFAFKIGQWYDVAISVDATNNVATYYVNGSSIGSVGLSSDDTSPLLYDSGHPIAVGENTRYLGLTDGGWCGCSIAQVALYPAALSSNDLLTHYEVGTGQSLLTASLSSNTSSVSAISNIDEQSLPSADVESGAPADSAGNTASAPLRSIPLSSSQLGSVPLRSIPLRSIFLRAQSLQLPAVENALSTTLLSNLPLAYPAECTGTACTGWAGLLTGTSLAINPLQSTSLAQVLGDPTASARLNSLTLGALDVSSTPLRSISLASIALAGVPLRSIPLPGAGTTDAARIAAWCQLLSNLGSNCAAFGIDPNNPSTASAVDLLTLELGGVSIDSIPLRSIPLRSIDVTSSPLRSIPLRSIDINSTPLRSIPLRSINLSALPLGSFPLRSIPAGSPAVNCSVAGVDCSSTSTQTLADAAAAGAIPSSATLADLANLTSNESLGSITNLAAGPLGALPLRSIDLSSPTNGIAALPLRSIAVASTPLRSIPLRSIGSLSSVVNCSLVDCTATSTATLGSASDAGAILNTASLGQLADLDDAVLGGISLNSLQLATNPIGAVPLRSIDDLTSIVNCATVDCTATSAATLASAQQAGAILSSATLDQLGPYLGTALGQLGSYGNATLSDLGPFLGTLLGDLLTNLSGSDIDFYLGDVLLGLVPPTSYPWQDVNLSNLPVTSIGTGGGVVTYTSTVNLLDAISEPVQMSIALPAGLSYIPGSSRLDGQAISDPSGPLSWTETLTPGTHTLTVRAASAAALGPATATLTTTLAGRTPQSTTDTVNVVDGASGPDAAHAVTFFPNHLVLGYLNGPSDSDWWSVSVAPGSELALSLSNLPADYDMALFSPATVPLQSGPTTVSPGVTDSAPTVGGQSEAPPTSNDINAAAPSGYQLYAVSQNRGTADENIQTPPLAGGNYLVHVTSYGGAWSDSPYVLQATTLTGLNPSCSISYPNAAPAAGTLPSSYPSNVNTLFLVNTQRLTEAYGSSAEQSVMSDLSQVASDSGDGVVGAVVPVDGDAATQAAYGEWQANACSVDGANAVVAKISDLVDQIRADHPTITSVVIVGADDQIPFARLADGTVESNERDYGATTFPGETNVLASALSEGYYFSDDPYVSSQPISVGSATLYNPQVATGRLVETPAEIENALTRFVNSHGEINAHSALSTGYSFFTSGAQLIAANLAKVSTRTVATLISENWTHQQLDNALESTNPLPTIDALNAHFDFGRALPAAGNTSGNQSDLFTTSDITAAPNDFAGSLLFSMGCHSGLNIDDAEVAASGVAHQADWATSFADAGALWVGNTGYGYGDTASVAYSARLMANFADNLDGSSEVGTALVDAKQTYAADNAVLSPYDLKSVMEATLYGLPMYRLNSNPPSAPTPPTPPTTSIDPVTGLATATVNAGTTASPLAFESVNAANGTYFQVAGSGQLQSTEYRPIEPLTDTEITEPGSGGGLAEVAHGALVTALTSNDQSLPNPAISSPGVDDSSNTSVTTASDPFPTSPVRVATYADAGASGTTQHQQLDVVDGQYLPGPNPSAGTQRLFPSLSAEVFYTSPNDTNYTPPTITSASGSQTGGTSQFTVTATDPSTTVKEVTVLYTDGTNPGTWTPVTLTSTDGTTFTGSGPSTPSGQMQYVVQAVDADGNVAISSNKGAYFPAVPPQVAPTITSAALASFTVGAVGNFKVAASGTPAPTVALIGNLPAGLSFNASTGYLSGSPAEGTEGTYSLTVTATGGTSEPVATQNLSLVIAAGLSSLKPMVTTTNLNVDLSSSDQNIGLPVSLSWGYVNPVTVSYTVKKGTAVSGRDFNATAGSLTFNPGQTVQTIPLTELADGQGGNNLTFTVKIASSTATVAGSTATVTLINPLGPMTATVDNPGALPAQGQGSVTFHVSLSSPAAAGHPVTVKYATANGTAVAKLDYTKESGLLTFQPGQSTLGITVPVVDKSVSAVKNFTLVLSKPVGTTLINNIGTATIAPGISLPPPTMSIANVSAPLGSSSSVVNIPVNLQWASASPVTVNYATSDGSASSSVDYEQASGTLTFAPGQTTATIPVTVNADPEGGANRAFTVALSSPNGAVLGQASSLVTLIDLTGPVYAYADNTSAVVSSSRFVVFPVSLSQPVPSGYTVTVPYTTANGSALAGTDYTAVSGTLTFTAGQSTLSVDVPILDLSVKKTKTLYVDLGTASGATSYNLKGSGLGQLEPG